MDARRRQIANDRERSRERSIERPSRPSRRARASRDRGPIARSAHIELKDVSNEDADRSIDRYRSRRIDRPRRASIARAGERVEAMGRGRERKPPM